MAGEQKLFYASLNRRLLAYLMDFVLFVLVILPITERDVTEWKSFFIFLLTGLVSFCYKPFMEYKYGGTLGKLSLRLKCVNREFETITLQQAVLRNISVLLPGIMIWLGEACVFLCPEFNNAHSTAQFGGLLKQFPIFFTLYEISSFALIIDCIFIRFDKEGRSLHDRIAQTLVVYAPGK